MAAPTRFGPLCLAGALALVIVATAVAGPGDLDPTFGDGGSVAVSPYVENAAVAAALQRDGKILLAGWADDLAPPPPPPPGPFGPQPSNADFLVARLTSNGALDPTFGSGGVVRTPIDLGNGNGDFAWAVAQGPGGKVVLGGNAVTPDGGLDFAFVRYTSTGALDASFSGDGIHTVNDGRFDYVRGVAVQSDGKVVAVGRGGGDGFAVIRLFANGELDTSFGSAGMVNTPIGDPAIQDEATAVLLIDGKVVVAGIADWQNPTRTAFALVRYRSNGQLDRSFGTGGIAVGRGSYDQRAWALAPAPGRKLVVAGQSAGDFRVARYLPTGARDRAFGGQGFAITSFDGFYAPGRGVAVQTDGKVVVGGLALGDAGERLAVARYNLNGSLDRSFGVNGRQTYPLAARVGGGASVLQRGAAPGGGDRFVVAGMASAGRGLADHVAAIGVDLGTPGPALVERKCRVPRVVRLSYGRARRKINRAHCSVGRMRFVLRPRLAGIVLAQSPRPGRVLPHEGRVNLVLGRR